MTSARRSLLLLGLAAASTLALTGCAGAASAGGEDAPADGVLQVVASTNVYGEIAEQIGGDAVEVTSIVASGSQDPHSYEPSARDQLTVSEADVIIENGGGYDSFIDALIESSGSEAPVVTAVEYSHDWPENAGHDAEEAEGDEAHADESEEAADSHEHAHDHVEGFNEHVWYDPHTIEHVAEAIAEEFAAADPDNADTYTANAEAFAADAAALEESLATIGEAHAGESVFVTEPVPVYLVAAAGLENVTPEAFGEAVEEGQDVAPATLLESLSLIESGGVGVVITNTQTGGAETEQIVDAAETEGIPVIAFSETLPDGQTYISWMQANIEALSGALNA